MDRGDFRFLTSVVTADELGEAPHRVRELLATGFAPENILNITDEMEQLAAAYRTQAVLTPKYSDDARHVAVCTIARIDYLVSWNFRHLVNVQRENAFNAVNLLRGYPSVRIVNPLELIYGNQDQSV
jgi:hypothetical protein